MSRRHTCIKEGVVGDVYVGSVPTPVGILLRTLSSVALGELGRCGTLTSCDGRLFNEQQ